MKLFTIHLKGNTIYNHTCVNAIDAMKHACKLESLPLSAVLKVESKNA